MALLTLLDRPIAFHRIFAELAGSVTAGLMLSQAFYWANRTKDAHGWFYKSQEEWQEETGLKRSEQEQARTKLRATGFWQEERRGVPARLYFRVDLQALARVLMDGQGGVTLETILETAHAALKSLSKAGYMRAVKAGVHAEYVAYADVLRQRGMVCGICHGPIVRSITQRRGGLAFDYMMPLAQGGPHILSNLHPAHAECHGAKGGKSPDSEACHQNAYGKQTRMLPVSTLECLPKADKNAPCKQAITEITSETTPEKGEGEPPPPEMLTNERPPAPPVRPHPFTPSRRCPADYVPSPAVYAWAAAECPAIDVAKVLAKVRNWEFKSPKSDWDAVLQTWISRDAEELATQAASPPRHLSRSATRTQNNAQNAQAALSLITGGMNHDPAGRPTVSHLSLANG